MADPDFSKSPPKFGHDLLKFFSFRPNYINLNHGSWGSLPKYVAQVHHEYFDECETCPEIFNKGGYFDRLEKVRERVSKLLGANKDEVVMIPNTSTGINTILRNFEWSSEDVIVGATTTFTGVKRTIQSIEDFSPHPKQRPFPIKFPTSREAIVRDFREHLQSLRKEVGSSPKIVAVIDGIISAPAAHLPWEEMTKICKEFDVRSVIDGAHCLGQIALDMSVPQPDFFVTDCHKWLFTKRSTAVMYVPRRNQHLIKTTIPTSLHYKSPGTPLTPGSRLNTWPTQFLLSGTYDYLPWITTNAALDFREWLGGEKVINEYCHHLVLEGGKRLAEIIGTEVLDTTGELTANMSNVALPFPSIAGFSPEARRMIMKYIDDTFVEKHNAYVMPFVFEGKWWARCSAQVYNEMSDFETIGRIILEIVPSVTNEVQRISVINFSSLEEESELRVEADKLLLHPWYGHF